MHLVRVLTLGNSFLPFITMQRFNNIRKFPSKLMTITLGGGPLLTVYIIQSFQKFFLSPFVKFPPPIRTAICK